MTGVQTCALPILTLRADLRQDLPLVEGLPQRAVASVFIGGGTPSLFPAGAIDALLSAVRARMPMEPGAEVTLEANPGTVEAARFRGYREAGVNRISVGVQSFDDGCLRALGRIHSANEARRAVDVALAEVGNVNLDLMYALPGQTLAMARADIDAAASLGVPHVSAYQLTIEPNTVFFSRPPALPAHDEAAAHGAAPHHRVSLGEWVPGATVTTFTGREATLRVDWAFRLDALSGTDLHEDIGTMLESFVTNHFQEHCPEETWPEEVPLEPKIGRAHV